MDTFSTLLVNSAATIATTYVVTRLSMGKPVFFSRDTVVSAFKRYSLLVFSACFLVLSIYVVVAFLRSDLPLKKSDIVFIPLNVLNILMYGVIFFVGLARARGK